MSDHTDDLLRGMTDLLADMKVRQAQVADLGITIEKLAETVTTLAAERNFLRGALQGIHQRWLDTSHDPAVAGKMMALEARAALAAIKPEKEGASDGKV